MSDRGPVDAIGKRPGDPIGPAPGSIAAHNMETLRLRLKEYHLHERFMVWKMNEWPESLQEHVKAVCGEVGMCGDVIAESVAGWIRGDRDGEMPGMTAPDQAPERIWAHDGKHDFVWSTVRVHGTDTEYVRADIHAAEVERLKGEVDAWEEVAVNALREGSDRLTALANSIEEDGAESRAALTPRPLDTEADPAPPRGEA